MASGDDRKTLLSRFIRDTRLIITSSWINWLLLLVPVSIILGALTDWAHLDVISPSVIFAINALAIVPLASLLAFATESAASRLGDTVGALMNITFGNAVGGFRGHVWRIEIRLTSVTELIIFIIALVNGQVRIVQAAVIGSILSNLLIILGMSFLLGGLRYQEQLYNTRVCVVIPSSLVVFLADTRPGFPDERRCSLPQYAKPVIAYRFTCLDSRHRYRRSIGGASISRHEHRTTAGLCTVPDVLPQITFIYVRINTTAFDRRGSRTPRSPHSLS